jgi:hypothetical protein
MNAEELYQLEAETNVNTSTKQDDESRTKWVVQTASRYFMGIFVRRCGGCGGSERPTVFRPAVMASGDLLTDFGNNHDCRPAMQPEVRDLQSSATQKYRDILEGSTI